MQTAFRMFVWLAVWGWVFSVSADDASLVPEGEVVLRFVAHMPDDTPDDAEIHLSGNHVLLGEWSGRGLVLERGDDGVFRGRLPVQLSTTLEFKVTLGSWDTVEKTADGGERPNRTHTVAGYETLDLRVERWRAPNDDEPARPASTVTGDLRLHRVEGQGDIPGRIVRVWLPPGYNEQTNADRRYPLLLMHDGQNLFDAATSAFGTEWRADETATALIEASKIEPVILVGIDNAGAARAQEYLGPAVTLQRGDPPRAMELGGRGDDYAAWVINDVLPTLEAEYRVAEGRANRATGGSSLGGVIALHLVDAYPERFGAAVAMSPALWVAPEALVEGYGETLPDDARYWIDMGDREGGGAAEELSRHVRHAETLAERLRERDVDVRWALVEGGEHNEAAWARRFGEVLVFLYGTNATNRAAPPPHATP